MKPGGVKVLASPSAPTGGDSAAPSLGGSPWQKMNVGAFNADKGSSGNVFDVTFTRLYGKMTKDEKVRLFWLAATLFFIIGGYWLLRSIKDPIIATINGVEAIPKAKMLSVVVVTVGVGVYNELYDRFQPYQLFYIIGGFYTGLFAIIGMLLLHPVYGISNTEADPTRFLGWVSYCAIESFGSIGVTNFWAFANSVYDLERAKKSYGLLIACAQLGSVSGPTLVTQAAFIGIPGLYFCGAGCMGLMVLMVFFYVQRFGTGADGSEMITLSDTAGTAGNKPAKKEKAGILEGLYLVAKYSYVQGITAISCIFMVEVTILDYAMKVLAKDKFSNEHPDDPIAATEAFAQFMGYFGQATNTLSFCLSLFGTSAVIRTLGLQKTLLLFPSLLLGAGAFIYSAPSLELVFIMMLALKALSYALNNPCKELLYQPTSKAVKFKAKSWIDIFGQRGAKALGSVVTNFYADSSSSLLSNGMMISMGLSAGLLYVSHLIGGKFTALMSSGTIVGDEATVDEPKLHDKASDRGTSCAIDTTEPAEELDEGSKQSVSV